MCRSGVMSWLMPSSAMSCVTVDGLDGAGKVLVTDICEPMSRLVMTVRCASDRPFIMISMLPNQNAGTGRIRYSARSAASSNVSNRVTTTGVSCTPKSATESAAIACAYSIVVLRSLVVGAAGAIATLTVFTTEGFDGVNSLERCGVGAA